MLVGKNFGEITLPMHLEEKTLANLVSILLHFNALIMFGWENFGKLKDNCQIRQCFPPPMFCAIRYLKSKYRYTVR